MMKKFFTRFLAALALLTCVTLPTQSWAQAQQETITSFSASNYDGGTTNNWSVSNATYSTSGGGFYQLTYSNAIITTPSINWSNYSNITITITARKYGGPTAAQGRISVRQGTTELTSYSPSNTSLVASSALSISPSGTNTLTISCPDASSGKGCGVSAIVIKGTMGVSYTIIPLSNNESYGTVSLNGNVITGSPNSGYRYADPAYTVNSGTADVAQSGNNFTVTPSSNCTITINFEPIPTHTATFSVNGTTVSSQSYAEGAAISFPANPEAISGMTFVGWVAEAIDGTTNTPPTFVSSATMGNSDVAFYACFAEASSSSTPTLTKMTSSDTFAAGDKVVIVAVVGADNIAMYQETVNSSYVNKYTFDNNAATVAADDKKWFTVSTGSNGAWKLGDATNGYVYTSGSNNLAISTTSSTDFTLAWNSTESKFTLVGNSRRLSYRSDLETQYFRMGGSSVTSPSGVAFFDIYKYETGGTSYSDYCTTVVAAAVEKPVITVAENPFLFSTTATITCATEGANILYKLNDASDWTAYNSALTITETTTIHAKAVKDSNESAEAELTVTKNLAEPTVTIDATGITNTDVYTSTAAGILSATVKYGAENIEGATVTWSGNNAEVATIDASTGAVTLVAAGSVTFTATYAGNADYSPKNATYEMTVTNSDPNVPGTENRPYTVAEAIAATPSSGSTGEVYIHGVVSKFWNNNTTILGDNNHRYYISDEGESNELLIYNGKGLDNATFDDENDLLIGDEVTIKGKLKTYNNAPEVDKDNFIVSLVRPQSTDPTLTANPTSLDFTYEEGATAVFTNSFTLTGSNLNSDVTVSLSAESNFQIQVPSKAWGNSMTLTPNESAINEQIIVCMIEGLSVGNYSDNITIDWEGTSFTVALNGTVTAPEGPNVTWNLSIDETATATTTEMSWASNVATMLVEKNNSSTATNNYYPGTSGHNYTSTRFYNGSKLTISPLAGYTITSVVFTATTEGYAEALVNSNWTNAEAARDGEIVTVTPTDGTTALSAVIGGTCGFTKVKVYYETYEAPKHTLTVSTLTNAEILVFDATDPDDTNWEVLLDDAGDVQVAEGTTIALSVSTEQGYILTELMVNGVNHLEDIDGSGLYTFTMPTENVTISATAAAAYTIYFFVNGEEYPEMTVAQGNALGTLPTPTENVPAGFTFVGWMESPQYPYYDATTTPTMVSAETVPTEDMILDAVFCISETNQGTWVMSNTAPVDGEQVILVAYDGSKYYAMNGPTGIECTVSNNVITGNVPEAVFTAVVDIDDNYLKQGSNYLHFNANALKLASGITNGAITYTAKDGGFTLYANGRYMTHNSTSHGFGVTEQYFEDDDDAATMYIFKFLTAPTESYDYTTLVTNHENDTYIAEDAAETLYGIHYINGYVLAANAVTNSGKLVVKGEGTLDMSETTLNNSTPANFVIEDGGQVKLAEGNTGVYAKVQKNITGYGEGNGNWYLLSAPQKEVTVEANPHNGYCEVANLMPDDITVNEQTVHTYDLYRFDQTKDNYEWQNFRQTIYNWAFYPQRALLYARRESATIEFNVELADKPVVNDQMTYSDGKTFAGWNLVGNAMMRNQYVGLYQNGSCVSTDYYRMNADGTALELCNNGAPVAPMEGFFVQAPDDNTYPVYLHFSSTPIASKSQAIDINVAFNNAIADRARVRFGEGSMLGKFNFNESATQLYIPQGNKDYAVVRSNGQGEMPVNFKAETRGTYTLNVNAGNVDVTYLHLIDNLTGMDVDLLANPSYSFEANKGDNANRFRLVFKTNADVEDNTATETFAYFNGSEWVINNPSTGSGSATLQVIDMMGRVLRSEQINGNTAVNINQAAGIYMLRLINGENVMVQKVVVR